MAAMRTVLIRRAWHPPPPICGGGACAPSCCGRAAGKPNEAGFVNYKEFVDRQFQVRDQAAYAQPSTISTYGSTPAVTAVKARRRLS